jgi:hypothetical protein
LQLVEILIGGSMLQLVVDVLRQCSKACVVKRDFKRAEVLIKLAVHLARCVLCVCVCVCVCVCSVYVCACVCVRNCSW